MRTFIGWAANSFDPNTNIPIGSVQWLGPSPLVVPSREVMLAAPGPTLKYQVSPHQDNEGCGWSVRQYDRPTAPPTNTIHWSVERSFATAFDAQFWVMNHARPHPLGSEQAGNNYPGDPLPLGPVVLCWFITDDTNEGNRIAMWNGKGSVLAIEGEPHLNGKQVGMNYVARVPALTPRGAANFQRDSVTHEFSIAGAGTARAWVFDSFI